jgi:NTP pyrophosphatase (non-canonical NTP hydrolase)
MLKYNPNINLILNSQSVDVNKTIVIEELSELQKELCKDLRGYDRREEIKEEMSDVYIYLQLLKEIYNFSDEDLEKMYERKMKRNIQRIKEG